MDLRLLAAVLWRFRRIVIAGTILAIALAVLTTARVVLHDGKLGLAYRSSETWESSSRILLTQKGFPWGRSTLPEVVPLGKLDGETQYAPRFADIPRFQGLASVYASLADGDEVGQAVLKEGPIDGTYEAHAVTPEGGATLPMIDITGTAGSPEAAARLANRVTDAFRAYMQKYQEANGISEEQRVEIPVVRRAADATLIQGRSLARPIFIFLLMMSMVIGLAFLLENLEPRYRRPDRIGEDVAVMPLDSDRERVARRSARR